MDSYSVYLNRIIVLPYSNTNVSGSKIFTIGVNSERKNVRMNIRVEFVTSLYENVGKTFVLAGEAEISDYYNYNYNFDDGIYSSMKLLNISSPLMETSRVIF